MNIRETDIYEEGIAQGAEQKAIEIAKQGLLLNISYEQLSQLTGLSLEIVEQLGKEQTNQNQ
jgi:predicted transposase YdaD